MTAKAPDLRSLLLAGTAALLVMAQASIVIALAMAMLAIEGAWLVWGPGELPVVTVDYYERVVLERGKILGERRRRQWEEWRRQDQQEGVEE